MKSIEYSHDGCRKCAYEDKEEYEMPCVSCCGIHLKDSPEYKASPDLWTPISGDVGNDAVLHPAHYTQGNIECIDAMESAFGADELAVYCKIAAFKYIWRTDLKNGAEDVKKAIWYLNKYIELKGDGANADTVRTSAETS